MVVRPASRRLSLLILFVCSFVFAAEELETYKIPADIQIGEKIIPAGNYVLQTEEGSDGAFLKILKGGEELAKQKTIVLPARGEEKTTVTLVKPAKEELVRFKIRESDHWYILYAKTAPSTDTKPLAPGTQD